MISDTLKDALAKMDKAVEVAKEDFAAIRTGRAHPGTQTSSMGKALPAIEITLVKRGVSFQGVKWTSSGIKGQVS